MITLFFHYLFRLSLIPNPSTLRSSRQGGITLDIDNTTHRGLLFRGSPEGIRVQPNALCRYRTLFPSMCGQQQTYHIMFTADYLNLLIQALCHILRYCLVALVESLSVHGVAPYCVVDNKLW
ncbi:hypothetical protein AOQ84DRAFT_213548 [Glonium stellatum]|uniref:Uncharacterized protein n=1 Tax=Glonium stellatum TaxID=574774 RepID=A0A8E2F5L9_9PEZI|nr:hypothetical protein AOQ84DRAFT_213548 [Glonium stellatum]